MATGKNHTGIFKKNLVDFIGQEDLILAMLEWTAQQMMRIEAETKVGASKGEHSPERKTYFSGTRVRRIDTRVGTVYLFIPKLRKGGCITLREFFRKLKQRGVQKICLGISDAHQGILKAIKSEWVGSSWQRCKVHFMRNIMARIPHKGKKYFAERLKQIYLQSDKQFALSHDRSPYQRLREAIPRGNPMPGKWSGGFASVL